MVMARSTVHAGRPPARQRSRTATVAATIATDTTDVRGAVANRKLSEPAELEQRLAAGEWLRTGEVAVLARQYWPGLHRTSVDRWIKAGKIGYRESPGGQRLCDPADVRHLLDEFAQVRRGSPPDDAAPAAE